MNREEFFAFSDRVIKPVIIKEMNGATLYVRSLNAAEKAEWEYAAIDVTNSAKTGTTVQMAKDRMMTARERLVELATCTKDGSPYFKKGDAKQIATKNANIVSALYDAAAALSGITRADLEEIAKNSSSAADAMPSA